ncbi:hypothetical protein B0H14DRAFT_3504672 [Mycena olivaceomarginata]|nr:hypothetical protein B0H14DRAFT_3504672 [Mycena olivaceomarginata]
MSLKEGSTLRVLPVSPIFSHSPFPPSKTEDLPHTRPLLPYPPQTQLSAAQIGENFRGQLFAQCAQGIHQPTTKYGVFGIITAVVCFPCGLIALCIDVERKCDRCGINL